MKIRPLQDRILVKRVDEEAKTAGGIIIPDTAKEKPQEGKVVATGNGKAGDDGNLVPLEVKKGDRVQVKLLEIDDRGKMRLSRKALLKKEPSADGESREEKRPARKR